ncbi:restriction endonuclease [Shouchella lonarensis]|uniref:Restriction endonuclease n=1 Tax=Shouchella lonarensis TaxID=1464122 RepID=A0A1G6NG81_9BACI|nr:restriction endonuclease [Shouchella lonarensis]SDC66808.1 Restriction endonuclease [Shouchella lonarensis]
MTPNYDFHNCFSPREFEEFVRDMLEVKEGIDFEISGRGKDQGIDLRHWKGNEKIIVQVKCYRQNYRQLFNDLKKREIKKAKALEPSRYILVTSLELQLHQRREILTLFDGLIAGERDIIDRTELNKLLGKEEYHHVECKHNKLWISSTNILMDMLGEVVHSSVLNKSKRELKEIQRAVKVFVSSHNFERAINILEQHRYVLISGEPGIGKTTLGRCLSAYFLQRKGYRGFIYADTVETAWSMYKEDEKQVFFFDDFWGDIFKDEKLPLKEEKNLMEFINFISSSDDKILILTSREYVLQQGLAQYQNEKLRRVIERGKLLLKLDDYSEAIKGKILFNHLYFSDLEWDYVKVIADNYTRIIHHQNYNPRMIEVLLEQEERSVEECSPTQFFKEFMSYLDDPESFWKSIFMKQTYGAQLTALILFLSSQPMRVSDLQDSYHACLEAWEQSGEKIQDLEFSSIMTQLEKTMINTYSEDSSFTLRSFYNEYGKQRLLVKFQNPSIKDFLYQHLNENMHQYGKILIRGCPFFNQLLSIFRVAHSESDVLDESGERFCHRGEKCLSKTLETELCERIISDFDYLKYSYAYGDVFENTSSVYEAPHECTVRKVYDTLWHFGVNESTEMDAFLRDKIQQLCIHLHEGEYPFSYDDMAVFPHLIKLITLSFPLDVHLDGESLIQDYYDRSRSAEHFLNLHEFEKAFPNEFAEFNKVHYQAIQRDIMGVLYSDVDFFASDCEHNRISFLIDIVYPQVLKGYKLDDDKGYREDLRMIAGYDEFEDDDYNKDQLEESDETPTETKEDEYNEQEIEELMEEEKAALLGGTKEFLEEEDVINFIRKTVKEEAIAEELIGLFKSEIPWYIWTISPDLDTLSLFVDLYHKEKHFPLSSADFYRKFASYLIEGSSDASSTTDPNCIAEALHEFAFDMMESGRVIFSENKIRKHPSIRAKLESGHIELDALLSFSFLSRKGKWYEFQTVGLQAYLATKKMLSSDEGERKRNYANFLDLEEEFRDIEHDIWLLCSELDLEAFNHHYLIPILKEYLSAIDVSSLKKICSSTFEFLELKLNFKISQVTLLPYLSGSSCNGLSISALDFIDHDLTALEDYMSWDDEENSNKNKKDLLLRLGQLIMEQGSLRETIGDECEYELCMSECMRNDDWFDVLKSLGVCDFLWDSYFQVCEKVEKSMAANGCIRLDSYVRDPKTRKYVSFN